MMATPPPRLCRELGRLFRALEISETPSRCWRVVWRSSRSGPSTIHDSVIIRKERSRSFKQFKAESIFGVRLLALVRAKLIVEWFLISFIVLLSIDCPIVSEKLSDESSELIIMLLLLEARHTS